MIFSEKEKRSLQSNFTKRELHTGLAATNIGHAEHYTQAIHSSKQLTTMSLF